MLKNIKRRKYIIIIIILFGFVTLTILGAIFIPINERDNQSNETENKPRIVDHFACSDNCPGPEEQYWVKIYEGVEDREECEKLGGTPLTYYGWSEYHICAVE